MSERLATEQAIVKRLTLSRRLRLFMSGIALTTGIWTAATTDMDASIATATLEEQKQPGAGGDADGTIEALGLILATGAATIVERRRTTQAVERMIQDYAGTDKHPGFSQTTLSIDEDDDLVELKEIDMGAVMADVRQIGHWLAGGFRNVGFGVSSWLGLEAYETFVTNEAYHDVMGQRAFCGVLAAGFLVPTVFNISDQPLLDLVEQRLDNIDNGLSFQ